MRLLETVNNWLHLYIYVETENDNLISVLLHYEKLTVNSTVIKHRCQSILEHIVRRAFKTVLATAIPCNYNATLTQIEMTQHQTSSLNKLIFIGYWNKLKLMEGEEINLKLYDTLCRMSWGNLSNVLIMKTTSMFY